MKRPYYLFSSGRLKRQHNTLSLAKMTGDRQPDDLPDDEALPSAEAGGPRSPFPVESVDSLFLFGEIDINSKLITFLGQQGIPAFFYDYYGNYTSTLFPRESQLSGHLRVQQAQFYLSAKKRLLLARAFVEGALFNIERVIKYYQPRLEGKERAAVQTTLAALCRDREALPNTRRHSNIDGCRRPYPGSLLSALALFSGRKNSSTIPLQQEREAPSLQRIKRLDIIWQLALLQYGT